MSASIEAHRLSLERSGQRVLDGIDVQVHPGDIIGVLGRNGAGKTTLFETLLGFHPGFEGEIAVFGRPVRDLADADKPRIGFVPQRDELLDGLSGRHQVELFAAFQPNWDHALLDRLASEWSLDLDRPVRRLSLGQRQRLSIVLALAARPDLLVLDEPVASLDPLARGQFLQEMLAIAAEPSRSLVFSSHIVADLDGLVNRIWVIEQGRMRWQGPVEGLGEAIGELGDSAPTLEAAFRALVGSGT